MDKLMRNRILTAKQENQLRAVTMPRGVLLLFTARREVPSGDSYRLRAVDIPAVSLLIRPVPVASSSPKPGRVLIRSLTKGAWPLFGGPAPRFQHSIWAWLWKTVRSEKWQNLCRNEWVTSGRPAA